MSEVNKVNSFDDNVSWWFHESYYEVTSSGFYICTLDNPASGMTSGKNTTATYYLFSRDQFGVGTEEYITSFCDYFGYFPYFYEDYILVLKEGYKIRHSGVSVRNNPEFPKGTIFIDEDENLRMIHNYVSWNGLPGDNYYWSDGSETVGLDTGEEYEDETEEDQGDIVPGDDDTGDSTGDSGSDYEPIDVENLDDAVEILKEIYNAETSYHTEMLEVEQNGFDISVVSLSLNFCMVFLCGILVGCAFARSLWHKMNVG